MACCADYRIMAREPGRIGIPELLVGVPFPVVPLEIVRFATPPQHLQALIYRGLTLPADEALRYGLVDAVVDAGSPARRSGGGRRAAGGACRSKRSTSPSACCASPRSRRCAHGGTVDAVVQDAWAGEAVQSAVRDYVARTLKRNRFTCQPAE